MNNTLKTVNDEKDKYLVSDPILVRYLKPSQINNNQCKDNVFQLREDRKPPEEYISFYHSQNKTTHGKVKDVKLIMEHHKYKIKNTGGFLLLDTSEALEYVNLSHNIIAFKVKDYPHYGMSYISNDIVDIVEAKTTLLSISKLYFDSPIEEIEKL